MRANTATLRECVSKLAAAGSSMKSLERNNHFLSSQTSGCVT